MQTLDEAWTNFQAYLVHLLLIKRKKFEQVGPGAIEKDAEM